MLRAFRWNLRVLSYISLVVGAFLIYNTISVSVVRRRPEIGVLRALGAGRQRIFVAVSGRSAAVRTGRLGCRACCWARVLAGGAVGLIAQTVNCALREQPAGGGRAATARMWRLAILAGMAVAFFSAFAPAREAMQVAPTEAMGRGAHEHHARLHWRRDLGLGRAHWRHWRSPFRAPADRWQARRRLRGHFARDRRRGAGRAGGRARRDAAALRPARARCPDPKDCWPAAVWPPRSARTSVMVGALATAIAMMASVGIMVGSFRETVVVWLDTQLRADLYVRPAARGRRGPVSRRSRTKFRRSCRGTPGVEAVDIFHGLEVRYRRRARDARRG